MSVIIFVPLPHNTDQTIMRQFTLILLSFIFCIGAVAQQSPVQSYHTIQKGETLFQLTQKYQVTAEAICHLNPGLSVQNFQAGKTIAIPIGNGLVEETRKVETIKSNKPANATNNYQDIHQVKKKETLYSIAQMYQITVDELQNTNPETKAPGFVLKKGTYLTIPYHVEKTIQETAPTNEELFNAHRTVQKYEILKVALILPFSAQDRLARAARLYYRGFMLAADSIKRQGVNMDIHILDSGKKEEKIDSLLKTSTLLEANLVLCPQVDLAQNKIAAFSRKNRIVTLVNRSLESETSPYMFVFNPALDSSHPKVIEHFLQNFSDANIIILDMKDTNKNTVRGLFTKELKESLTAQGKTFRFLSLDSDEDAIKAALSTTKHNVIVPNSANVSLLQKRLIPTWKVVVEENPNLKISLFGYQEWLSVAQEQKNNFYTLDTHIFSKWWLNPNTPHTKQLANRYHYWFKESMPTRMPSAPAIGFDSSYYMLKGMATYGNNFTFNQPNMNDIKQAQSFIEYVRPNSWSGFVNNKVGFVHFNKRVVNVTF